MQYLLNLVRRHKAGEAAGIYSVCSAHPLVIEAAMEVAAAAGEPVLIEATSNQVNQDGGYTGMTPVAFRDFVHGIAGKVGLPRERVLLGGDHLGPNAWQDQPAGDAMARAEVLIEQYVLAGFRKIHLDCSMSCAGDPVPLPDAIVARRAARLCAVAETAWKQAGGEAPVYIVGTEVPVPGGAHEDLDELAVTTPLAAAATSAVHRAAFAEAGLHAAWPRVIGLVVQPGVEFDHHKVIDYRPEKAQELSRFIEGESTMVYEAHSTDYQIRDSLAALVRDHFAILKVGPAATYAFREAVFALAMIEAELLPAAQCSNLIAVLDQCMRDKPGSWRSYYQGDERELRLLRAYSLSDRSRYYWGEPAVVAALQTLVANLRQHAPPQILLSQFLPNQQLAIEAGELTAEPLALIQHKVAERLGEYARACNRNRAGADNETSRATELSER